MRFPVKLLRLLFPRFRNGASISVKPGFAEQDPGEMVGGIDQCSGQIPTAAGFISVRMKSSLSVFLTRCMDWFVLTKTGQPLRPAIIWCDSRAVAIGE